MRSRSRTSSLHRERARRDADHRHRDSRLGAVAVPVSFGYHPYLVLPGIDRAEWKVEIPVREQLELDRRLLPTGSRRPTRIEPAVLGSRTFDDAFVAPEREPFVLEGGGRRIELLLDAGYPFAQVYAPGDDDVIAFEPMTAPTNALVEGGAGPADRAAGRTLPGRLHDHRPLSSGRAGRLVGSGEPLEIGAQRLELAADLVEARDHRIVALGTPLRLGTGHEQARDRPVTTAKKERPPIISTAAISCPAV